MRSVPGGSRPDDSRGVLRVFAEAGRLQEEKTAQS